MIAMILLIIFLVFANTFMLGMAVDLSLPVTRYPRTLKFLFFLPPLAILYYLIALTVFGVHGIIHFFVDHYKKISNGGENE